MDERFERSADHGFDLWFPQAETAVGDTAGSWVFAEDFVNCYEGDICRMWFLKRVGTSENVSPACQPHMKGLQ